jgi:hypothetical protein
MFGTPTTWGGLHNEINHCKCFFAKIIPIKMLFQKWTAFAIIALLPEKLITIIFCFGVVNLNVDLHVYSRSISVFFRQQFALNIF